MASRKYWTGHGFLEHNKKFVYNFKSKVNNSVESCCFLYELTVRVEVSFYLNKKALTRFDWMISLPLWGPVFNVKGCSIC